MNHQESKAQEGGENACSYERDTGLASPHTGKQ